MKNKILPFILAVIFLSACENTIDDRERPVPKKPVIAWLLSVQLTKIPQNEMYYACDEINTANPKFTHNFITEKPISSKDLPILWKISGAQRLDREDEVHSITIKSIDLTGKDTISLLNRKIPTFNQLKAYPISEKDTLKYPTKISYEENGVACTLIFRYD